MRTAAKLAALAALTACRSPPAPLAVVDAGVDAGVIISAPLRQQTPYARKTNPRSLEGVWTPDGERLLIVDWGACTVDAISGRELQNSTRLGRICTELDAGTRGDQSIGDRFVFWRGDRDPVTVLSPGGEGAMSFPWPKNQLDLLTASNDGAFVLGHRKGRLELISLADGGVVAGRPLDGDYPKARFSPDGKTIASIVNQGVELLAVPSLKTRARVPGKWLGATWYPNGRLWLFETDGVRVFLGEVDAETGKISRRLTLETWGWLGPTGELVYQLSDDGGFVSRLLDGGTPAAEAHFSTSDREGLSIRASSDGRVVREIPSFDLEPLVFDWKNLAGKYRQGMLGHLGGPYCDAIEAQLTLTDAGIDGRVHFSVGGPMPAQADHVWHGALVISDGGELAQLSGPGWSLTFEPQQGPVSRIALAVDDAPGPCARGRLDRNP